MALSMDSAEEKEQRADVEEEGEEEEGEEEEGEEEEVEEEEPQVEEVGEEVEEEEAEVELEGEERAAVTEKAKPTVHHIRLQIQQRMSANNHTQTSTKTVVEYSPARQVCWPPKGWHPPSERRASNVPSPGTVATTQGRRIHVSRGLPRGENLYPARLGEDCSWADCQKVSRTVRDMLLGAASATAGLWMMFTTVALLHY
jgi:hypothetical protein